MEIYVDVLFVINFCMDFVCLYLTGRISRSNLNAWRLSAAAVIGGIYSVAALFIDGYFGFIAAAAVSPLICAVAFKGKAPTILKRSVLFFFVSALIGGTMFGIYSLSGSYAYYNGTLYLDSGLMPLISAAAAASVCALIFIKKTRASVNIPTARVTFETETAKEELEGLIDTGLLLCDPISADCVILLKKETAFKLTGDADMSSMRGFRLIPSDRGLIPAFRPRKITITYGKKDPREIAALVGIDESPGDFGGFPALIPASLVCF